MRQVPAKSAVGFVVWVHTPWSLLQALDIDELLNQPLSALTEHPLYSAVAAWRANFDWTVRALEAMRITDVRTNISWAESVTPAGRAVQDWYITRLGQQFRLLPCVNYTPLGLSENGKTNGPPTDLGAFATFVGGVVDRYGPWFDTIQLWNEPNLDTDWDPACDPTCEKFAGMIQQASRVAREKGKRVMLGGINKLDLSWIERFCRHGGMEFIDVAGFNGLRGTWSEGSLPIPWPKRVEAYRHAMTLHAGKAVPIVMTECGFPTIDFREQPLSQAELERVQAALFVSEVQTARELDTALYWYTLSDQSPNVASVRQVTTGWEDKLQYHFGCFTAAHEPKLLGTLLLQGGPEQVIRTVTSQDWLHLAQTVIERGAPS